MNQISRRTPAASATIRDGLNSLLGDTGKDTLKGGAGMDAVNPCSPSTGTAEVSDKSRFLDLSLAFDFDALLVSLF